MAAVLLIALALAAHRAQEHLLSTRSPLLLLPPHSPTLTERDLQLSLRSWTLRERALSIRYKALSAAMTKGDKRGWDAVAVRMGEVERAREEARWVVDKLGEAVRWVEEQGVKKGSWKDVVRKRKRRRSRHEATPPSLWEMELPLPVALGSADTRLTVQRAAIPPPPAYSPDLAAGERVMERREMMWS